MKYPEIITQHLHVYMLLKLQYNIMCLYNKLALFQFPSICATVPLYVAELLHIELKTPDEVDYLLAPGEDVLLYCRPNVDNLKVWWTAKNSEGESVEIDGKMKLKV